MEDFSNNRPSADSLATKSLAVRRRKLWNPRAISEGGIIYNRCTVFFITNPRRWIAPKNAGSL
jgi:hypothetical protein